MTDIDMTNISNTFKPYQVGERIKDSELRYLCFRLEEMERRVDFEIRQRVVASRAQKLVYAADFDIIYDYLVINDLPNIQEGLLVTEALLQLPEVAFTLLPGTLHEIINFCSQIANQVLHLRYQEDLMWFLKRELHLTSISDLGRIDRVRSALSKIATFGRRGSHAAKKLEKLLSDPKLTEFSSYRFAPKDATIDPAEQKVLYELLEKIRPSYDRMWPNHVDSLNLSICLAVYRKSFLLPLITKSSSVQKTYIEYSSRFPQEAPSFELVLAPRTALLAIGLRNASLDELESLNRSLSQAFKAVAPLTKQFGKFACLPKGLPTLLNATFERIWTIQYAMMSLLKVHTEATSLWSLPLENVPEDIDIDRLAQIALETIGDMRKQIQNAISAGARFFSQASDLMIPFAHASNSADVMVPMLDLAGHGHGSTIFIEKLVLSGGELNMGTYNLNQRGKNLVAVVDSFKNITVEAGKIKGKDFEKWAIALLSAVEGADITENEKKDILDGASAVLQEATKGITLVGRAKVLWYGLRSMLDAIPSAVEAWEKLTELWS